MKKKIRRAFNGFTLLFLVVSLFNMASFLRGRSVWNDIRENGVRVDAVVVDAVESCPEDPNKENIHLCYTYEGKEYTFVDFLHADSRLVGQTVTAYVSPADPQTLFLNNSGTDLTYFFLMLGLAAVCAFIGFRATPGN